MTLNPKFMKTSCHVASCLLTPEFSEIAPVPQLSYGNPIHRGLFPMLVFGVDDCVSQGLDNRF
jgi:hypothetical protein